MAGEPLIFGLWADIFASFAEVFARYPAIERVLIFGSRAKDTAKPWSDIDLAVMAPAMTDQEFSRLWNDLDDLPIVFKLDVLHFDRLERPDLKEKILSQGRRFYPPEISGSESFKSQEGRKV